MFHQSLHYLSFQTFPRCCIQTWLFHQETEQGFPRCNILHIYTNWDDLTASIYIAWTSLEELFLYQIIILGSLFTVAQLEQVDNGNIRLLWKDGGTFDLSSDLQCWNAAQAEESANMNHIHSFFYLRFDLNKNAKELHPLFELRFFSALLFLRRSLYTW